MMANILNSFQIIKHSDNYYKISLYYYNTTKTLDKALIHSALIRDLELDYYQFVM